MSAKPTRGGERAGPAPPPTGRIALLPTIATVVAVAIFIAAGNWQRARMEQKREWRDRLEAAEKAPPIALPRDVQDFGLWRFRNVELAGTFDAGRQILIDNRVHDGRSGYLVVAPLLLPDGRAVLVERGWVAAPPTRRELPLVPPPSGPVVLRGRLMTPSAGYLELRRETPSGPVWQNFDPARFSAVTGLKVENVVVEQAPQDSATDGLVRSWPAPDTGIEKHRIYMVQWYAFAVLAIVLWAWFHLRRRSASEAAP